MPIINRGNGTIELKFGKGDIRVAPATLQTDPSKGLVCFFREEDPNAKVGDKRFYADPLMVSTDDIPVQLTFDDINSIAVLMRALEDVRSLMTTGDLTHKEEK